MPSDSGVFTEYGPSKRISRLILTTLVSTGKQPPSTVVLATNCGTVSGRACPVPLRKQNLVGISITRQSGNLEVSDLQISAHGLSQRTPATGFRTFPSNRALAPRPTSRAA